MKEGVRSHGQESGLSLYLLDFDLGIAGGLQFIRIFLVSAVTRACSVRAAGPTLGNS